MVQTCSKCSRANPSDAVYCYFDGFVLGGHTRNGGPVAVGAQTFGHPFVFPTGRQCRNFDELALACQEEWNAARELLQEGFLEKFLGGLGRVDLARAAGESAKFPNADLGLHQLLEKLPTEVLGEPRLSLETQEINLGVVEIGGKRSFDLHLENQGMRLISGTITSVDAPWLALGDAAGNQKHFHFQHEWKLPLHIRTAKLRANDKPLEGHLEIESNGGSFIVVVRAQVPVIPFPSGVLAGAKSPRQVAEKAKANAREAAALFETGAVADWYKSNGWTYPVQGPAASGLGAVQQFFEALGLTPPPKVEINASRIDLIGTPGEQLSYAIEVKSQEKRPVYAHASSNQPWLEVGRAKLNGRTATINLSVPSVPHKEGETLNAKLIVQSNGNQRFIVPVTLQVGGALVFGAATPAEASAIVAPSLVKTSSDRRRSRSSEALPSWIHLLPAALLLLALLTAVVADRLMPQPPEAGNRDDDIHAGGNPFEALRYHVKDPDPLIAVRFDGDTERFGVELTKERDPENNDKYKRLTFDDHGKSNNTVINIDNFEYKFGDRKDNNRWGGPRGSWKQKPIPNRKGWTSTMEFTSEKVEVTQLVEIVPGESGYLDTVLVYYTIRNNDEGKHKIGIRAMIDTFIGGNDGVPFTIPGKKGFVDTKADLSAKSIPDYIEVIENPNDPKNPGTVARMGLRLKLPGIKLDEMDRLLICRFPGHTAGWDIKPVSMKPDKSGDKKEKPDSCVIMYWPYEIMNPKDTRHVAFTYGLGSLDVGGSDTLALSVPASVLPDSDFVVTAYVWNANKGDKVKLIVPNGLRLAQGESEEKVVDESGARTLVFWRLHSSGTGEYELEASKGKAKANPKKVVVKAMSIFG